MDFFGQLTDVNQLSVIIRLLMAVVCGGVIGMERGKRRQAAGFRTHILVCMGSALVTATNLYISKTYDADAVRITAQIVSGIGFLGVGTIIVTGNKQIKGLTTAAGLWTSACMGISIGAGFYLPAFVTCVLIVLVMTVLNKIEQKFYHNAKIIELYIEFADLRYVSLFLAHARESGIKIGHMEITKSKTIGEASISILAALNLPKRQEHSEIISYLSQWEGINFIEEM